MVELYNVRGPSALYMMSFSILVQYESIVLGLKYGLTDISSTCNAIMY